MAIRVLVVEDSLTVRRHLCELLESDADLEVVGEAEDGKRAIELCTRLRPDAITMDMMMPLMSGLAATEYIMAHCPTPILVVSASTNRGELYRTYEALAAGAIDVLEKPTQNGNAAEWRRTFIAAIKLVSRIRAIPHPRARLRTLAERHASAPSAPLHSFSSGRPQVVAVGASTGGPAAVLDILRALPAAFPLPLLLVVHIGEPFGTAFAEWLDGQAGRRVRYARDREAVSGAKGEVVMAPPGRHLIVDNGRLRLTDDPPRHSCRPSVDRLFESIAHGYGAAAIGCLLTGMGRDGADGLLAMRKAGALTIAQDEATSVVYGMPREAVLLGAAKRVLALCDIGPALTDLTTEVAPS